MLSGEFAEEGPMLGLRLFSIDAESVRKKLGCPSLVVARMGVASPPASKVVADSFLRGVKERDLCLWCPPSGWPRTHDEDKEFPVLMRLGSELCTKPLDIHRGFR